MFTDTIMPRFSETDALGHINNNTYGIWFEAARDSIYKIFIPSLNAKKWNLIMAHSSYDFLAEVHYGKEVIIKTALEKIGNSSFHLNHAVYQNKHLCTTSKGILIHFDHDEKKSVIIPSHIKDELNKHLFNKAWPIKLADLDEL